MKDSAMLFLMLMDSNEIEREVLIVVTELTIWGWKGSWFEDLTVLGIER